jgi:hypothetical protein
VLNAVSMKKFKQYFCASTVSARGCLDSCMLDRLWQEANEAYGTNEGGPIPPEPGSIRG